VSARARDGASASELSRGRTAILIGVETAVSLTALTQPDAYCCFVESSIVGLPVSALFIGGEPPATP
jgi:hypothetical protein